MVQKSAEALVTSASVFLSCAWTAPTKNEPASRTLAQASNCLLSMIPPDRDTARPWVDARIVFAAHPMATGGRRLPHCLRPCTHGVVTGGDRWLSPAFGLCNAATS